MVAPVRTSLGVIVADAAHPPTVSRRTVLAGGGVAAAAGGIPLGAAAAADPVARADTVARLTEGTNMMVTAGPDGSRLAIDLVTAIWVLPVQGGTARRLTTDVQDATRPAWSPDGSTIAFQSYRDGNFHIWTIGADGTQLRQLTSGRYDHREPHWLPDGSGLVLSSDRGGGSYGIWRLDLATGELSTLTDSSHEEGEPAVSANGRRVAFTVDALRIDEVNLVTGTRTTRVAQQGESFVYGPAYAPGGTLAYVRLDGAASDLVVGTEHVTSGADVFAVPPCWLSDDELVYTADGSIQRYVVGTGSTRVPHRARVPVVTDRPRPTPPDIDSTRSRPVHGIASPTVSPDGSTLAFRALNALWLADTSGGRPRRLMRDGYFNSDPDFSPDGGSLLYASDRAGTADLWQRDLATGLDTRLSGLAGAQTAPRFSPDGERVAYQDQDGIAWVIDLAAQQVRQLTPVLFQPGRVSWAPDGETIVLAAVKPFSARFREGTSQLLYVDVASGDLEYVAPMPFRSLATRGDDGPVFSPDGRHLAFVVESRLHVVRVDTTGRFTADPYPVTDEVTDSPVWQDERTLLYLHNGRLRRTDIDGRRPRTVPLDLSWRRPGGAGRTVIRAGRLWDGQGDALREDVDVVVQGTTVTGVRPHRAGGTVDIDASDLTVMPGLIDAHNHWHLRGRAWGDRQGRLWLSYGITTTRSPGDPVYQMQETREALDAGARVGPRYFATGEAIDGSRVYYNFMRPTLSVEQLGLEVDRARGLAYDLVKTYVRLPVALQRRAVRAVHLLGIKLSSHYLYPAENLGMDGMEHTGATNRLGYSHTVSRLGRAYGDVVTLFTRSGMSVTPTLFNSTPVHVDDQSLLEDRRTRVLYPPWEYTLLLEEVDAVSGDAGDTMRALLAGNVDMLLRIHRGGGLVIAGTDAPLDNVAISLHANLRAMVGGGFTPREALGTATANPARWLGLEGRLGVVRPGAKADLSFVRGDPLDDITAAADVRQVMVGGRLFDRAGLLEPYASPAARDTQPSVVSGDDGPQPLAGRLDRHAHVRTGPYWWHQPEWLHRVCCEG